MKQYSIVFNLLDEKEQHTHYIGKIRSNTSFENKNAKTSTNNSPPIET